MQKREIEKHLVLTILATLSIIYMISFPLNITGLAIQEFNNENDFNGIYTNTEYSNQIILSLNNLKGNYTQTINVGKNASWNNIDLSFILPKTEYFFVIDKSKEVFISDNLGLNWTTKLNYPGTDKIKGLTIDTNNNLFILDEKKIYKSEDLGTTWTLETSNFNPYDKKGLDIKIDSNDNLYIIDKDERVFKSSNEGINWTELSDFNGASTEDLKAFTINSNNMFTVDKDKAVFHSNNLGLTWTQKTSDDLKTLSSLSIM